MLFCLLWFLTLSSLLGIFNLFIQFSSQYQHPLSSQRPPSQSSFPRSPSLSPLIRGSSPGYNTPTYSGTSVTAGLGASFLTNARQIGPVREAESMGFTNPQIQGQPCSSCCSPRTLTRFNCNQSIFQFSTL